MCKKYNGWTNQETWSVHLWLTNDYNTYTLLNETIKEIKDNPRYIIIGDQKILRKPEIVFAEFIEELVKEKNPLENWLNLSFDDVGLFTDLLNLAIAHVNYNEIALNLMEA